MRFALVLAILLCPIVGKVLGQSAKDIYMYTDATMQRPMYPVAVKTNLLYDLAGVPNIGIEVPVGQHFSAGVDVAYAHWQYHNEYTLQTSQVNLDAKYWFNARTRKRALTGWNAGVYGLYSGEFDVQWKNGYQGDNLVSFGISGGYSLPVSNRFSMEFAVAGGYVYSSEVRHYYLNGNYLIWEETRYNFSALSLTKLQVNLVWYLTLKKN